MLIDKYINGKKKGEGGGVGDRFKSRFSYFAATTAAETLSVAGQGVDHTRTAAAVAAEVTPEKEATATKLLLR
jgi:hypothetical protein